MLDRRIKDEQSALILPIALNLFVAAYAAITVLHILTITEPYGQIMTALSCVTAVIGLIFRIALQRKGIGGHASTVLAALVLLGGANSITHMHLAEDLKETTNLLFVLIVAGFLIVDTRWFVLICIATLTSWALYFLRDVSTEGALHFCVALTLAVGVAFVCHRVRQSSLTQLDENARTLAELKTKDKMLEGGEEVIKSLLGHLPAGIINCDSQLRIRFANESFAAYNHSTTQAIIDRNLADIEYMFVDANGAPLPTARNPIARTLADGEDIHNELIGIKSGTGDIFYGLASAFTVQDVANREPVAFLTFVDISERIAAERKLIDSEQRAQSILHAIHDGVMAVDRKNILTNMNPAAETIIGIDARDAVGRNIDELLTIIDRKRRSADRETGTLISHERPPVPIEFSEIDLTNRDNESLGKVLTMKDLRAEIRTADERAEFDKLHNVGLMASGIAHDFNNLLTAIYGNIALARPPATPIEAARFLDKASDSLAQATHLTGQLLTVARGNRSTRETINLDTLVQDLIQFTLAGSALGIDYQSEPDLRAVDADPGQIHQAVSNILINAKQAMNNSGTLHIKLTNKVFAESSDDLPAGDYVAIAITDEGPGISSEVKARLFEPYFTTKSEGTGLGLTTTYSIVRKHDGTILIDSSPGCGTTFTLLLPASDTIQNTTHPDRPFSGAGRPLQVLVMDDEELVRGTEVQLLQHLGHKVTEARHGQEAIDLYEKALEQRQTFDVVIMDLTVAGGMGGKDAAEKILQIDQDARLIVVSGYSSGDELSSWRELGFKASLPKPFKVSQLRETLNRVVLAEAS